MQESDHGLHGWARMGVGVNIFSYPCPSVKSVVQSPRLSSRVRAGFTRIHLLASILILAVLAGIIFLLAGNLRHGSMVDLQKADFAAIAAGLEEYKQDFGDYPRNIELPTWNTMPSGPLPPDDRRWAQGSEEPSPVLRKPAALQGEGVRGQKRLPCPMPAPAYYSLAPALLGPGPAVTQAMGGVLQNGDGNDSFGFRCQTGVQINGDAKVNVGDKNAEVELNPADVNSAKAFAANPGGLASLVLPPTEKEPFPETLGIASATLEGDTLHLTLLAPPVYSHEGACRIIVAAGKVWGPYISPQTFQVSWIGSVDSYGGSFFTYGQPVLLDRWDQVIQYFPRYGPNDASRPLFGDSQSKSVDPVDGQNALFDWRDGAPFFTVTGQTGPAQSWPNPANSNANNFRPELAIEWMLKNYGGPYFLISVGPGGLERPNGGFCNFADPTNGNNPLPDSDLQKVFDASGNLYSFERR
jgi:type II secretory pathway pseudopilin PulG